MKIPAFFSHLALVGTLAASVAAAHAQGVAADATMTYVQNGANYDYTITLFNIGGTNLNSFWYGWTTSGNNLPANPSSATNSLGWGNGLDGNSIQWANSTGTALGVGQSAIFYFVDTASPNAITNPPSGESVAYSHGIQFNQGLSGVSSSVFSPIIPVPEPSSVALLAGGAVISSLLFRLRRSRKSA